MEVRHGVLGVHVRRPAGVDDERARSVAAAGHTALHRVHDVEVLAHGRVPVELDHLQLFRCRFGPVEPPLTDQQSLVDSQRHPAERVEHPSRVALDRRGRPCVEGAVFAAVGCAGVGRTLRCRPLRGVVDREPSRCDAIAPGRDDSSGEGLVHVGAVVALVVVLDGHLPVRLDQVRPPPGQNAFGGVRSDRPKLRGDPGDCGFKRRGVWVEVDEQESRHRLDSHRRHAQFTHVLAAGVGQSPV